MSGPSETLCDELFRKLELDQGHAFISDGMGAMTRKKFFKAVRRSHFHSKRATRILYRFLKKYGEQP